MIKRRYPHISVGKYSYPKEAIKRFNELKQDKEFLRRYEFFKRSVDYRTCRKFEYYTKIWKELVKEFTIRCDESDEYIYNEICFEHVKDIDYEDYLKTCDEIDKRNLFMKNRNNKVPKIIEEIEELKYWNDYVLFEGEKYGISGIVNDIHRDNDCFGNIIDKKCCRCPFSYICDKCDKCIYCCR